jgi:hypothetical protein
MDWTYWQEVSVPKTFELFSDVTVCVFKNRFFFFWLELEERREQTQDGAQKTSWRLHPRYMRCDQNALTGAMLIPGLFLAPDAGGAPVTEVQIGDQSLFIDGAFEWTGVKPVLTSTYHPTRGVDGLVYGRLDETKTEHGSEYLSLNETLVASFGIAFGGKQIAAHIRLSDEWSDTILDLDGTLSTVFEENAPSGYASIHSEPILEPHLPPIAEIEDTKYGLARECKYATAPISVTNRYARDSSTFRLSFRPSALADPSMGSIQVRYDLGQREYALTTNHNASLLRVQEMAPTEVSVTYTVYHFSAEDLQNWVDPPDVFHSEHVQSRATRAFSYTQQVDASTVLSHQTDEVFESTIVLPKEWRVYHDEGGSLLWVQAHVERTFPDLSVTVSEFSNPTQFDYILEPEFRTRTDNIDIEVLFLPVPAGQPDSGWSQSGEHGSRNFLHLTEGARRELQDTFVVSNSSSVMAQLAKSMPRPGGCESLFQLENHAEKPEDYGTFLQDYPAAAEALSLDDDTQLRHDRMPGAYFDFDSAYGAYV